jgi:molecular chaperone HscB
MTSATNHFELFGLPTSFRIDADALDHAYRTLQAQVHPDRHASASDLERRVAMQTSTRVNAAYQALKDPIERARYLLQLRGIVAVGFLEQQLARRERAAEAADTENVPLLDAILDEVRAEIGARQEQLAALLEQEATEPARDAVRELRFLAKVAADVESMLAALD